MMKQQSGAAPDDPYAEIPELYDLEHAGFSEDIDLYLRLAEVVGDPILELGCGTGRVLGALAAAGNRVTGVDRSRPMLDRARSALQVQAQSGTDSRGVMLVEGNMTEAERAPGGPFGLVIFSLNGLMHLSDSAEQRAALDSARRALDPELWYDLVDPAGHLRRVRSGFPLRYLVASELALLLELTGFVEWKLYGSYDLDPYDDGSERLIATAEVTPS